MAEAIRKSVGLSLGNTSVSMAVVHQRPGDEPELVAFDHVSSRFLRDGMIVNLEALQDAVNQCRKNIAFLVKASFYDVSINLCGVPLKIKRSTLTHEMKKKTEIKKKHLSNSFITQPLLEDDAWQLVHSRPISYDLDDQTNLASPIGMAGKSLSVHTQQIFAPKTIIENVVHAINRCGFRITHIVTDPLSSFEALVTKDEQEMGIWLLDIGGNVMQTAFKSGKEIFVIPPIPFGSDLVTNDIAVGLKTTIKDAERIKVEYGCALPELVTDEVQIQIPPVGGGQTNNPISQHRLSEIINSRMQELLELAADAMTEFEPAMSQSASGIVITGGGSLLPGTLELANKYFRIPIIKGHLRDISGLTDIAPVPLSASAIGLALYALRYESEIAWDTSGTSTLKKLMQNVFRWLGGA